MENISAQQRYLNLLKQTLTFALWPDLPVPLRIDKRHLHRSWSARAFAILAPWLEKRNIYLFHRPTFTPQQVVEGRIWPAYADTMIGALRLDHLQFCIETILAEDILGDLIETGVWRGGACIFMRGVLAVYGIADRRVFVADSFQGLPPPDSETYPADQGDRLYMEDILAVSLEVVQANFARYGLLDEQVVFLKGWFKDTLPQAPIEKLAILRLDGDLYESTTDALQNLYPKLSPGGFCIIDDYALPACRQAVDDYRAAMQIDAPLVEIDWTGRYWRKTM